MAFGIDLRILRFWLVIFTKWTIMLTGSLRISVDGHDQTEPPIIVTPTSSNASPIPPKYLELLHDEHDNHLLDHNLHQQNISTISNGYEIPLADEDEIDDNFRETNCQCCFDSSSISSSSNTMSLGSRHPSNHQTSPTSHNQQYADSQPETRTQSFPSGDKERTFSSSSTVSELSDFVRNEQPLCAATILKVALPNSKEDCSSDDALLDHHNRISALTIDSLRIPTFYPHTKNRDTDVLACGESKTMM